MTSDDRSFVLDGLNWLYARVAGDLSIASSMPLDERDIDRWIRTAAAQAGAAGFATNVGGLLTLPIAIPANLAGTAAVQLRMVAKIAASRGYDTNSEEVKTFVFVCLLGNAAVDVLKDAGIRIGMRLSLPLLQRLNQTLAMRLFARFGAQGAVSVTKVVPVVSGLIGGGLDVASTRVVGLVAKRVFVLRPPVPEADAPAPDLPLLPAPEGGLAT